MTTEQHRLATIVSADVAVFFLRSDAAFHVTSHVMPIDGGRATR